MKKGIIIPFLLCWLAGNAQLFNDGAVMIIKEDALVGVRQTNMINSGDIRHEGFLLVDSSITNNNDWTCADDINSTIHFGKHWYNNNLFLPGIGLVRMIGNTQFIGGTNPTEFYDLILEGPPLTLKRMDNHIVVHDFLNLKDAELATTQFEALMESSATAIGRNTGFVSTDYLGRLNRVFDKGPANDNLFPLGRRVGNQAVYSPIILHLAGGTTFRTAFIYEDPAVYGMPSTAVDDSLCTVNDEFFHFVGSTTAQNTEYSILWQDADDWATLGDWQALWTKIPRTTLSSFNGDQGFRTFQYPTAEDIPVAMATERPHVTMTPNLYTVRPLESVELRPDYYTPGNVTYQWTPGNDLSCDDCEYPTYTAGMAGLYTITVDNGAGCIDSDTVRIELDRNGMGIFTPTAFTPNQDNLNEKFLPVTQQYVEIVDFQVYNRWGERIYQGVDGWDGTYQGELVEIGVYVWVVVVNEILGNGETRTSELGGTITVLR